MPKYCENCGSKVFSLGCTWCDETNYIEQQEYENWKDEQKESPNPQN